MKSCKIIFENEQTNVAMQHAEPPASFRLFQNHPNPFNSKTKISFEIKNRTKIHLKIYNIAGHCIQTLVNQHTPAGKYTVTWDASGLPSGIYFCRLETEDFILNRKMILMK